MAEIRKYKSLYSSTTGSFGTGTGETITPASVVGLPTDTRITLTFDRVDSQGNETPAKLERITGYISGGNFVIVSRGVDGTTEQAHTSPVVEMIWNAADWNDMASAFLSEHSTSGVHTNITASTVSASSISTSGTATIGGALSVTGALTQTGEATFSSEVTFSDKRTGTVYDSGNSGTSKTIDLTNGETQKSTLTGTCTYTLTNFEAGSYLTLFILVDGTGGYSAPTITASGVTFYHDDNNITLTANAINAIAIRFISATQAVISTASGLTSTTTL